MDVKLLINDFVNDKIDIPNFLKQLQNINLINLFNDLNEIKSCDSMDKMMHAFLLIYFEYHHLFNFSNNNLNPFCNYLKNIIDQKKVYTVEYILIQSKQAIIKLNNIYFFINNSNNFYTFQVVKELKGKNLYCLNCNDEFELDDDLELPDYSFYALLNE